MRSLVYFLPPRTSVTDSVGISTRPILSCKPKACTRDSSDSRTLRSNPEYEWMMYHFMFGLRGASVAGFAPWEPSGSPEPSALAFFSSSCIREFISQTFCANAFLAVPQRAEDEVDAPPDHEVHQPEIEAKDEDRDNHDNGSRLHFLQRRRGDLLHLHAHVVVEGLDLLRPRGYPCAETVVRASCCNRLRHFFRLNCHASRFASWRRFQKLAGAEGFEPPSPVLETGSLTVELTPLNSVLSCQFSVGSWCLGWPLTTAHRPLPYFTSLCGVCFRQ